MFAEQPACYAIMYAKLVEVSWSSNYKRHVLGHSQSHVLKDFPKPALMPSYSGDRTRPGVEGRAEVCASILQCSVTELLGIDDQSGSST